MRIPPGERGGVSPLVLRSVEGKISRLRSGLGPKHHPAHAGRSPVASKRLGFTLIEVIIALSLSLVLVSAIYSAVSLHWRYEQVGRERIDRSQVSLAVLRLFAEDIGSVAFTVPSGIATDEDAETAPTSGTTSGGTSASGGASTGAGSTGAGSTGATPATGASTGSSGTGTTGTATTGTSATGTAAEGTAATLTPTSLGIVGTAETLQIDISHPVREDIIPPIVTAATTTETPKLSDNVRVTWAMVIPSQAAPGTKGLDALSIPPALARQLTERLRDAVVKPEKASLSTDLDDSSILAREVVQLQFRYYDGYAWTSEWDSVVKGRLPRAIEVTLGFVKQEYKQPGSQNLAHTETIVPIKHVILVPASTPVSGEEI